MRDGSPGLAELIRKQIIHSWYFNIAHHLSLEWVMGVIELKLNKENLTFRVFYHIHQISKKTGVH